MMGEYNNLYQTLKAIAGGMVVIVLILALIGLTFAFCQGEV